MLGGENKRVEAYQQMISNQSEGRRRGLAFDKRLLFSAHGYNERTRAWYKAEVLVFEAADGGIK